jgi:hypothetical protein
MTIGAALWSSLRELVVAVGRRLIGKLLRGIARRWARRRLEKLWARYESVKRRSGAAWRLNWIMARIKIWERVEAWANRREDFVYVAMPGSANERAALCECSKLAKREGIPMDSPDDVEPKRAPRRAAA